MPNPDLSSRTSLSDPENLLIILGIRAAVLIAGVAPFTANKTDRGTIATAAIAAIGTIVGFYFGHSRGSQGKEQVEAARQRDSLKIEELIGRLNNDDASQALEAANDRYQKEFDSR
jgi:hypothetical protein